MKDAIEKFPEAYTDNVSRTISDTNESPQPSKKRSDSRDESESGPHRFKDHRIGRPCDPQSLPRDHLD